MLAPDRGKGQGALVSVEAELCLQETLISVVGGYKEASPTHVSMYHKEVGLAVLAPDGHWAMGIQRLMLGALALKGIRGRGQW